jgi:gamma-glutamylcysteine synthetase
MDIYDEIERIVPAEYKEDFLRVSRELREYGEHNPELLRIVEVVGLTSLYTADLPERLSKVLDERFVTFDSIHQSAAAQIEATMKTLETKLADIFQTEQELEATTQDLNEAYSEALKDILSPINDRVQKVIDVLSQFSQPIQECLIRVERDAVRARQIHAVNLVIALVLAFGLGIIITLSIELITIGRIL